jgi:hypothetical protein
MKYQLAVLCNDQITKAGIRTPASVLMHASEEHLKASIKAGLFPGTPSHIQHDMHRPIGWVEPLGHVIDSTGVQLLGLVHEVEKDEEKEALRSMTSSYWEHIHHEGMQTYQQELVRRISPSKIKEGTYLRIEAYVISRSNLAAELYPSLFNSESSLVDKDGLTNYVELMKRTEQVQPGVFLDKERGLVLFAHRFFRRGLSHKNKLNDYFLKSFEVIANKFPELGPRLRLDPDLIGHAQTVTNLIEQEFWRGVPFNNDVFSIPTGVTVLKAGERHRYFEGVDKTDVWWKSPEERRQGDSIVEYRTFEIEELIENEAGGLDDVGFGCRYAHSEYSLHSCDITHFDGAIRAYSADAYLERIETTIDHAGKHSDYTKLFRFDGLMPVDRWKRLLSDFFRGNPLIPEYFGTPEADDISSSVRQPSENETLETSLCAMVSFEKEESLLGWDKHRRFMLEPIRLTLPNGQQVEAFETGCAAVDSFFRTKIIFGDAISTGADDGRLNLPRMVFGNGSEFPGYMKEIVCELTSAIEEDAKNNRVTHIALALAWRQDTFIMTLSLRGSTSLIVKTLKSLFEVVDPANAASTWIESLSQLIKDLSPAAHSTADMTGIFDRRLMYEHDPKVPVSMLVGDLVAKLLESKPEL